MTAGRAGGRGTHRGAHRPDIVVVVSDDQGPWAMGCAGNDEIRTPHLDGLAAAGTRFAHFYAASPVCSPARASLLTGRPPSWHGVHDALHAGEHGPGAFRHLAGRRTFVEVLAEAGYRTGHVGKWHLGDSGSPQAGFQRWCAWTGRGSPYRDLELTTGGAPFTAAGYGTDVLTDRALRMLDDLAAEDGTGRAPFLLHVAYTAPHSPWIGQHPAHLLEPYGDTAFTSCPQPPEHPWAHGFRDTAGRPVRVSEHVDLARERTRESLQGYFAAVTGLDAGVGALLERLRELGLRESTLVLFLSDNGFNAGHHGIWGKGNGTFPLDLHETSVTVPALLSRPGHVPAGVVREDPASAYDVRPTLLAHAGVPDGEAADLPGRDLLHPRAEQRGAGTALVVTDEYGPNRMIRQGRWKYVHRHPYGPHELYDLAADPGEEHDLSGDERHAAVRAHLRRALHGWFVRYADPDVDGAALGVTGLGQTGPVGSRGEGRPAFLTARTPRTAPTTPRESGDRS